MSMDVAKFLIAVVCAACGGCAVGYNRTLFMTKSNVGLDVDTKPPTAEVSIARREGVIAPAFEGGSTPPVIASFATNANPFSRFLFGVQSTFAGGDAALGLSEGERGPKVSPMQSTVCLSEKPQARPLGVDRSLPEKGEILPFVFGTDTSFGLKVAWSGMSGQFPDTLRLGFNRKEMAWAPVFGEENSPACLGANKYGVAMPPFIAILDGSSTSGSPEDTSVKWLQYFATGEAARTLSNHDEVRRVMLNRIDAQMQTFSSDKSKEIGCFNEWLDKDTVVRAQEVQEWVTPKGIRASGTSALRDDRNAELLKKFITEKSIPCD